MAEETETTIVDFAAMAEAISGYKNKITSITDIMSALQAISKALQVANIFTGGAATAFIESIESTVQAMQGAIQSLNGIVSMLQGKLDTYQAADKAAEALASSIEKAQWSEV